MKKLTLATRLLMGLIFVVFGLNGFFHFIPMPAPEGVAAVFFSGMMATGYFFPLLAATQTACGALLLSGVYVPLALIVLAPMILNIFLFHVFVAPSGLPLAIVLGLIEVYLAFFSVEYSPTVKSIFRR